MLSVRHWISGSFSWPKTPGEGRLSERENGEASNNRRLTSCTENLRSLRNSGYPDGLIPEFHKIAASDSDLPPVIDFGSAHVTNGVLGSGLLIATRNKLSAGI